MSFAMRMASSSSSNRRIRRPGRTSLVRHHHVSVRRSGPSARRTARRARGAAGRTSAPLARRPARALRPSRAAPVDQRAELTPCSRPSPTCSAASWASAPEPSRMPRCTRTRFVPMQVWPALRKREVNRRRRPPSRGRRRRRRSNGAWPPSSSETFLTVPAAQRHQLLADLRRPGEGGMRTSGFVASSLPIAAESGPSRG